MTPTRTLGALQPMEAYRALSRFEGRRGPAAMRLAMHAAVPQSFRPDLLHLLKLNFVPEAADDPAVEADVLLAPFSDDLGGGYFQFDPEVRRLLLDELGDTYADEPVLRVRRVADFLLAYVERAERRAPASHDRLGREFLDTQRWVGLAFARPEAAAEQLASALKDDEQAPTLEARLHLGGLAHAVAIPLAHHRQLLDYALALHALETGDQAAAADLLEPLQREFTVGPVTLTPARVMPARPAPPAESAEEVATPDAAASEIDVRDAVEPEPTPSAGHDESTATPPALRVYISSSESDVSEYRRTAADVCVRLGLVPRVLEHWGTFYGHPLEQSFDEIEGADLFVCIVGRQYGSPRPGQERSMMEIEYDHAIGARVPVFSILVDGEVRGDDVDDARLRAFRTKLLTRTVVFVRSPDELRQRLAASLVQWQEARRAGMEGTEDRAAAEEPVTSAEGLPTAGAGRLFGVPVLPADFVAREEELARLRAMVVSGSRVTVLAGPQGSGKGGLAATLAREEAIRRRFPDGIVWATVGADSTIEQVLGILSRALGEDVSVASSRNGRTCLLILNGVEDARTVEHLASLVGVRGHVLVTTRQPDLASRVGAEALFIGGLTTAEALQLLARRLEVSVDQLPPEAREVAAAVRLQPDPLIQAAERVREGASWSDLLERLQSEGSRALEAPTGESTTPLDEMPEGAVYISYASEDRAAAERLRDGLQQVTSVWMDTADLVVGEAWDAKIHRNLNGCLLFIPVLSRNAAARPEGSFRFEWSRAVSRRHLIRDELPFVVPVVIDDLPVGAQGVPQEFWSAHAPVLPGGGVTPQFLQSIRTLLRRVRPAMGSGASGAEEPDLVGGMDDVAAQGTDRGGEAPDVEAPREVEQKSEPPFLDLGPMRSMATSWRVRGDFKRARELQVRMLNTARETWGDDNPETLRSMHDLALTLREMADGPGALELHRQIVEVLQRTKGPDDPETLSAMQSLAQTLSQMGDLAGARALQQQTLERMWRILGDAHPRTLSMTENLAATLRDVGDLVGAVELRQRVFVHTRTLPEDNFQRLGAMSNLANALRDVGNFARARAVGEETLEICRARLGGNHPQTLSAMQNLAVTLRQMGEPAAAQELEEHVLQVRREALGEEHPETLAIMQNLALTLADRGDLDTARALQEQILEISRRVLGEEDPRTMGALRNLANTLASIAHVYRRTQDAQRTRVHEEHLLSVQEQVIALQRRILGHEHPDTLASMEELARMLRQSGDRSRARALEERVAILRAREKQD